ncbi:4-hydroxy-3-methylbut-2-enyl diphosphate reductase [uncultured Bifidobacterium sp.]|uniref:4-hydroxy-3-methylbut-2-enyl diphosphate reductase n=1 Tax=uncultured Bifidobacterium sp. TaxID=165187 RepID=UPI002601B992|nr:4-hydroxy-3-methylbut-2-enyl diphosphate reductase [uncultured Bifidobacterium sp.]
MSGRIILADPRGFCAGVDRAILTVRTILSSGSHGDGGSGLPPVYVRRQIVHNRHVVEDLAEQGAVFVDELDEIPQEAAEAGVPVVFSAHGVSPAVQEEARRRGMNVIDATCPLVSKVHREVLRFVREGYDIVYIGHHGHDEAMGVIGEAPDRVHLIDGVEDVSSLSFPESQRLVLLTQTTLSVDETIDVVRALRARFPWIEEPPSSDICYATQNRQNAVKQVAQRSDCVVIVGSSNSSNSVRLMEVAQQELPSGGRAYRIDDASELSQRWFEGANVVGVSSGASVPEELVEGVVSTLGRWGFTDIDHAGDIKETMHFVMPSQLRGGRRGSSRSGDWRRSERS